LEVGITRSVEEVSHCGVHSISLREEEFDDPGSEITVTAGYENRRRVQSMG
jgi:hypothetical protein